jgi:hypothetical protein
MAGYVCKQNSFNFLHRANSKDTGIVLNFVEDTNEKKMMFKLLLLCVAGSLSINLYAQDPKFSVEVSSDTLLLGNYLEVVFTLENASGNFEAPDLSKFNLRGGPNRSSSLSIINGEVSQSTSYSYYIEAPDIGNYTILPAYVTIGENVLETPPIDIIVVPNPDGIIQQPHRPSKSFGDMVPRMQQPEKSKSKRKRKIF